MIKSENTEKHKELRQLFNKKTGIYAIKDNESYMNWLENMVVKNCSIPLVSNSVCPECGYPKFKKHHEYFERCNGCDWTSK